MDQPTSKASGLRTASARLLLSIAGIVAGFALIEAAFRLGRVHVGTIQINRATVRASADPRLRFELVPGGVAHAEVDYEINAWGFRGPAVAPAKPPGVRRLIVLGDSIAFGYWVAERDSFPRQLEALLASSAPAGAARIEVLNFGVPGYNLEQEVELLRTRALRWQPDVVVVAFCLNDLHGALSYEHGLVLERSARRASVSGRWREATAASSRFAAWIEYRLAERDARRRFAGASDPLPPADYAVDAAQRRTLERSLDELASLLSGQGATGLVAVFPLFSAPFDEQRDRALRELVTVAARRAELRAVDLFDCLSAYDVRDVRVDALHPNPMGHRIAAHAVRDALCGTTLPCRSLAPAPACTAYTPGEFPQVRGD